MPVQQITVVPAKETASNGKSAPRSKDKNEAQGKAPGRSGSRSSNISKASNSTAGLTTASKTSITPSSQDICSSGQLSRLAEDDCEIHKSKKSPQPAAMTVTSTALGSSAQHQKKQVKRRHRRKRSSCAALDCVETNAKREQTDRSVSSDRSERGEKRERSFRNRRDLPPRLRCSGATKSDSSSEDEVTREARSWSKEKARRARRRSGSKGEDKAEVMELQSMGSEDEKENQPLVEDGGGLKKRHSSRSSAKRDGHVSPRETSQGRDKDKSSRGQKSRSPRGSSSLAEEGEEFITKRYQERGAGGGDMSVPTPQKRCGANGGLPPPACSDDSELEVCRICHCEGDDDCPLIMPCRCTGSLSFVHQACLNQWIKSSDTRCCELCKFDFIMETKLKPLRKWEKLHMSKSERRKIFCSVFFHLIAIVCMLWSVYILIKRTTEEIRLGKNGVMEIFSSEVLYIPGSVGVALLDQADRGGHRLHGRPHLHVHSVQGLPAAVAPPQGLQPNHHRAELPREEPGLLSGPIQRPDQRQARGGGGPRRPGAGSGLADGLGHVGGGGGGAHTEPRLTHPADLVSSRTLLMQHDAGVS